MVYLVVNPLDSAIKLNAGLSRIDMGAYLRYKAGQEGRGEILLENSFMR